MSRWLLGSLLCLTLLLTGCPAKQEAPGDAAADPKAGTPGETVPSTETATQASFPFPTRTAKSLEGNWVLVLSEQGKEFSVALLKITPGSPAKVEELETLDVVPGLALKAGKVAGKDVTLTFDTKNGPADLQGTFQDGIVRGTFAFPPVGLDAARLIPTSADSVKAFPNQRPAAGTEELTAAAQQKEPTKAVWGWARGHRTAPLSLDAYLALTSQIGRAMDVPWNDEIVNALAGHFLDSAKVWGPRMERRAQVQIAVQLAASGKIPEIALQYIDKALPVADSEDMKAQLGFLREANQTLVTMKKLKTAAGEEAETLAGELKKALEKQEFNALILQALADHARKTEKYDEAIEYYGQIVALPLLEVSVLQERASEGLAPGDPTPHEQLTEVWKKAHNGSTDGLDAYLDQTYETRLANLKEKARKSAPAAAEPPEKPRRPLVEEFTGVVCPPCVGAGLALDVLMDVYQPPTAIVLTYHQHIPGPDPLTNRDTEDRFSFYQPEGAPAVFVNGKFLPGVGGYLQGVSASYQLLRRAVDGELAATTDVTIDAKASFEGQELVVDVNTDGLPEDRAGLKLRVALVERMINFRAPTGLRQHPNVVRALLGGAKGITVKQNQLKYSSRIPLTDIREELTSYLRDMEVNRNVNFPVKPMDLKGLFVVAWVQNDKTREVLQSTLVELGETPALPAADAAADAPAKPTPPAPATPAAPANPPAEPPAEKPAAPAPDAPPATEPAKPDAPAALETSTPESSTAEPTPPAETPATPEPAAGNATPE